MQVNLAADAPSDVSNGKAKALGIAFSDDDSRNLDVDGRTMLAAHDAREQLERPVLAQVGEQYAEIDAGLSYPAVDRLVKRRSLVLDLRQLQECGVGPKQSAVPVGQHEAVGSPLEELLRLGRSFRIVRCGTMGRQHRRKSHQEEGGGVLPEEHAVKDEFLAAVEPDVGILDLALAANGERYRLGDRRCFEQER